jgi:DNA-directed RNA polymerase specialized sigma subunit
MKRVNTLVSSYVGDAVWTDEQCIENYQLDPDMSIASAYQRYFGMLYTYAKRFKCLSKPDIESIAFETISKCLATFKSNQDTKFATYLTRIFKNRVIVEYRYLNAPSMSRNWYLEVLFDNSSSSEDENDFSIFSTVGYCEDYGKIEMEASLDFMTLSNTEYAYVASIIQNGPLVSDAEIAREIGVSRAAVSQSKKKLKEKLKDFL